VQSNAYDPGAPVLNGSTYALLHAASVLLL